jgi:hypothetical protein
LNDGTIYIDTPELAGEFAKRIVGGLIKAARAYVPTRKTEDDKREYVDVSILDGAIYLGTEHSLCAAMIRPDLAALCKKKSPLREMVSSLGGRYSARLNYGTASPWIKTHEKNVRSASIGPQGVRLVVAPGVIELDLSPTAESEAYARDVAETIRSRVLEENLVHGPFRLEGSGETDMTVLVVDEAGARYAERIDKASRSFQLRFRPQLLPGGPCDVRLYRDPIGEMIVRFTTDEETMHVEQYFRALNLSASS